MAKDKKATKAQTEAADQPAAAPPAAEHAKEAEIREGPVLTVIHKRLRAANKKLRRCEELENRAAGKTLNSEQASSLRQPHLASLHDSQCISDEWSAAEVLMAPSDSAAPKAMLHNFGHRVSSSPGL
jgi:hypothetical protein